MYIQIQNENFGYDVTTYGDYVVASNPATLRFTWTTASIECTGSVDFFRYNRNTDEHDYIGTLYQPYVDIVTILSREVDRAGLMTERTGSFPFPRSASIAIDKNDYTKSLDDGFGLSLDLYQKNLIVGSPYFTQVVKTSASLFTASFSTANIYNLGISEYLNFTPTTSCLIFTLYDPDMFNTNWQSESFGRAVAINSSWAAVGSPSISGSHGMVYIYRAEPTTSYYSGSTTTRVTWSLYQRLEPSGALPDAQFGYSLCLNKATGSYSQSMVIGCGNPYNAQAYYFELIEDHWSQSFVFTPDYTTQPMTFGNYLPHNLNMVTPNWFGKSVSLYGEAVAVGEPYDRIFNEYSGSSTYQQGSAYIFERCVPSLPLSHLRKSQSTFKQVLKTYGNQYSLKNNRLGWSVDMYGGYVVAGSPKVDVTDLTSCYVGGTLEQLHYCDSDLENLLDGQAMLIGKNTSSLNWEIVNIYQKKKKYLSPYRSYGFDVGIADKSMVVGAPIYLFDSNRQINITTTASNNVTLDDVTGKAYIYNLKNLRHNFHVGNVFYRNGKIILMTSGSVFDGLFFNPVNTFDYEYDLQFKGQHTIFEKQVVCSVSPGEFNVSTNPTAILPTTASLDVNGNGRVDFQDVDIILRYMQYKNTSFLGVPVSTNWSSSVVVNDDEKSLLQWYQQNYNDPDTATRTSESIVRWETDDTWMQDTLDLNEDNKIDIRDINIMWKYFANRLTQENYAVYITPACKRKLFSDIVDYMDQLTQKSAKPLIDPQFMQYERSMALDKTGSYLSPMATTIGLYSGLDLVAVAKLGNPIKITPELPVNFVVKMDF